MALIESRVKGQKPGAKLQPIEFQPVFVAAFSKLLCGMASIRLLLLSGA
jgi:hypothetical protein